MSSVSLIIIFCTIVLIGAGLNKFNISKKSEQDNIKIFNKHIGWLRIILGLLLLITIPLDMFSEKLGIIYVIIYSLVALIISGIINSKLRKKYFNTQKGSN